MRISHLTVADSDDRPDVSTRLDTAMPTCGSGGESQNTPAGSGVKGRDKNLPLWARGFSATLS